MITISTTQDGFDGFDSFKLKGTIKFSSSGEEAATIISTYGRRKSEAVEKAIKVIDELIETLEDSKEKLGAI